MESLPLTSTPALGNGDISIWRQVFDPENNFIINWNRFELLIAVFNVFLDPLFYYLPIITSNGISMNLVPARNIALLRMIGDSFHLLGMFVKIRTAYEASGPRLFRRREFVKDPGKIAMKYLKSIFIVDLVAVLPLPQVYLWCKIPTTAASMDLDGWTYYTLSLIISFQVFARLAVVILMTKHISETSGMLMMHAWSGAAYCLLIYILLSQIAGGNYYSLYISGLFECEVLEKGMRAANFDWDQLLTECFMTEGIERSMFSDIHVHKIGSRSFTQRYMYCFSWGLKCLSSMAQNFDSSYLISESCYSFFMTLFGLVLFAGLIAQMQTSIQCLENGEEQQIVRQREIAEWTDNHQLPLDLKERIRYTVQSDWRAARGLDDEAIIESLPSELQCDIRRELYLNLACNLPFFTKIDEHLAHSLCGYLRAFSSSKGTCIVVEGEPAWRMFLISGGQLEVLFMNGGCSTSPIIGPGDICGQELLPWASCPTTSIHALPASNQTLKCLTDVEAFFITAKDLKLLAVQFGNIWNFQEGFRLHSP